MPDLRDNCASKAAETFEHEIQISFGHGINSLLLVCFYVYGNLSILNIAILSILEFHEVLTRLNVVSSHSHTHALAFQA